MEAEGPGAIPALFVGRYKSEIRKGCRLLRLDLATEKGHGAGAIQRTAITLYVPPSGSGAAASASSGSLSKGSSQRIATACIGTGLR